MVLDLCQGERTAGSAALASALCIIKPSAWIKCQVATRESTRHKAQAKVRAKVRAKVEHVTSKNRLRESPEMQAIRPGRIKTMSIVDLLYLVLY